MAEIIGEPPRMSGQDPFGAHVTVTLSSGRAIDLTPLEVAEVAAYYAQHADGIDERLLANPAYHRQQASALRVRTLISQGWGSTQANMQVQLDNQNDALGRPRTLLTTVQHSGIDGRGTAPSPDLGYPVAGFWTRLATGRMY